MSVPVCMCWGSPGAAVGVGGRKSPRDGQTAQVLRPLRWQQTSKNARARASRSPSGSGLTQHHF